MWNFEAPNFLGEPDLPNAFEVTNFNAATVKSFSNYLSRLQSQGIPIAVINVNSYGGDAGYLAAMLSLMDGYRARGMCFCGVVSGVAYSAGALIFLFCDNGRRYAGSLANLMLHQLQLSGPDERLSSAKNNTDASKAQQDALFQKISKHLKKKPDWLSKELARRGNEDWYFSAQEAAEIGLAEVGLPQFNVRVAAEFSISL